MRHMLAKVYPLSCNSELVAMKRAEHLSEEDIRKLQNTGIEKLLRHAFNNVSYYRRVLSEAGVVRESAEIALENFSQIPLLTKEILRSQLDELKSSDLKQRKFYYNTSGGSTGEPVRFIQDAEYKRWVRAGKLLYDVWTGYHPGLPKVILWGSERDLFMGREATWVQLNRWLKNEVWINAFRMTEDQMRQYVEVINHHKPVQILAYVESIYELARFIEREGLPVYSPRAIMTSAGTLYPYMREVIERVFQAPVFNRYGSREVGDIACECEAHKGLHISPLTHYVEILREDGTPADRGETGEVVVTSLVNYAMPLIRYRIGDMAIWAEGKCSCGRAWPLLKKVVGRATDIFTKRDGTKIVPEYFIHIIGVILKPSWLRKFQVIQEDYELIRILVVPAVEMGTAQEEIEKDKEEVEQKVRLVMGDECRVEIKLVEDIPPSPSGKYRYTISHVSEQI